MVSDRWVLPRYTPADSMLFYGIWPTMTNAPDNQSQSKKRRTDSAPTEFPKSARPIYVRMGLLLLIIAGLCIIAEQCGDPALKEQQENVIVEVPGMKLPFDLGEGEDEEDYEVHKYNGTCYWPCRVPHHISICIF